jgi:protein-disulfide isomerase-like protein with CxxC motif
LSDLTDVRRHLPEIQRLQALTLLQSRRIVEGEAIVRLEDVARLAQRQGAATLEWRAVTSLAELLEKNGQAEPAREH